MHAAIEEQVFYPATREYVESAKDDVLESLEEHHIVKWTLSELEGMDPKDERFEAKVTVLMESVRHHVKEEEQDMFPKGRKAMSRAALANIGERMEQAKAIAPTRPHPRAPDEPPANVFTGTVAVAVDAGRDLARGVADAVFYGVWPTLRPDSLRGEPIDIPSFHDGERGALGVEDLGRLASLGPYPRCGRSKL
jgi:hypothetical protein